MKKQTTKIDRLLLQEMNLMQELSIPKIKDMALKGALSADNMALLSIEIAASHNLLYAMNQMLKTSGININMQDPETGNTALHWAAKKTHLEMINLLKGYGADVAILNLEGISPKMLIEGIHQVSFVEHTAAEEDFVDLEILGKVEEIEEQISTE